MEVTVLIERLAFPDGQGVGRVDGFILFVPETAPGDRVRVQVTQLHPRFGEAIVLDWLERSSVRRHPPCDHFATCGGCSWQHLDYPAQVKAKSEFLHEHLRQVIARDKPQMRPLIPAPEEWRYRNRIQLHFENGRFGYRARGSHQLIPIDDCLIADKDLLAFIPIFSRSHSEPLTGRYEIAKTRTGEIVARRATTEARAQGLFSQVNSAQNERLLDIVLAAVEAELPNTKARLLLDLYCGAGNFTLPLSQRFPDLDIVGIEASSSAVQEAEARRALASGQRLSFHCTPVEKFLAEFEPKMKTLALVDPPRTGLTKAVLSGLLRLQPEFLIYISCHLATLARDLERLSVAYEAIWIQGLDMFPQTAYVEVIVFLRPRNFRGAPN